MHNTCVSSTISLRYKGSLSFSFNDCSYLLNDRFDINPLSLSPSPSPSPLQSSCCPCCANSLYRLSINPSFLYGLKQSTLIQRSATRRLILGGGDHYCYPFPVHNVHRNCYYGNSCSLKERSVSGRRGRLGQGRFGCMVAEERSERHRSSDVDDAEVMLSLLTEDMERNCRSSRRLQMEKRGNAGGNCYRGKKKNVGSGLLKSNSRCEFESVKIQSRDEDYGRKEDRQKEDKENFLRDENRRVRKGGSSCSSYYSFSSSGAFESDNEVQVKREGSVGGSSSGYKRDPEGRGEVTINGDVAEGRRVVLKQENTAVGSYTTSSDFDSDWRKKSEKKLSEKSIEQPKSGKESSQKHSRLVEVRESGYGNASGYHKQYDDREEKSTLAVNIDEGTKQQYSQTGHRVAGEPKSGMKYKQFTEMPEIHGGDIEMTSSSQKKFKGREENLGGMVTLVQERRDKHHKTDGHITRQDEYSRKSKQVAKASEIEEIDIRGTSSSQRHSETRAKNREDNSTVVLSSVRDTEEQHHQAGQWASRRKPQQLIEISDTHAVDIENTSSSQKQSDTRMKKQEGNSNLVFISCPEAKEQHFQTGQKANSQKESGRESHDITNTSTVHSSDTGTVANAQKASEKRMSSQEIYSTSVVKSVEETRERYNLTDERVLQVESRKEAERPTKALSFSEGMLKEASSSQASLHLKPQPTMQQIGVDEGDKRSSRAIVLAPPSLLAEQGPLHVKSTSGFATQEISSEYLESGYSVSHTHLQASSPALQQEMHDGTRRGETYGMPLNFISHEDALGSADRLQKSSMHFVGEFVEKARHEASISEIQKEKKTSGTMSKGEKSQYGSGDFQSMEHETRRSSWGSGTKGPSDEVWDVTDPSIQEPPRTEVSESATTTGITIVKRTGRSLWNIIADIVRLRWSPRTETHSSAVKSGGRSSSNHSTSSEVWFSGHEPDENNVENVKKEKRSTPQEPTSADQQQVGKIPTWSQGEGSSSISSKDKIRYVGVDTLSSSSILESGSASKSISLASGEETVGSKEDGKNFQGYPSGTSIAESSLPLPARRIRSSVVEEISGAGKTDISGSGLMVQMEEPISARLSEVSGTEGKDGELKRMKLQRNNQVLKDRFDEWEEAYSLESEQRKMDEMFMREALLEAKKAADNWEVPVGAVLVQHGKIIARGYNLVEELRDSTAHAEMICIREASNLLQTWRLSETTLYITLEPCPMCAGAILQARIDTVVWGAPNKLLGADGSWIRLFPNGVGEGDSLERTDKPAAPVHPFHPKMTIRRGVLASECADVMQQFFQLRRKKKEKKPDSPTRPSCLPISNHPSKLLTKMHDAFNIMFCL
uniref:tRNA(adenine(34)) deaminase n=1 Tax=Davidia involucrata TaxID=16924 RepID=A0A5B7C2G6_DAVIN